MVKLELLAPAKDAAHGRTAIDYGADAVYIGGPAFGARRGACNTVEDISGLVRYAHMYGAKVYAALNTLVFDDELEEAEDTARRLIAAGVDALIVQDPAFLRMGLPDVEFHASTQMCNITPEGIRFLQGSGFSRVILERGLTLEQIKAIRRATSVELECFVHGAVCVGFSGRCYMSRSMGPRSGNRGDCMQACRLPYDLTDEKGNVLIRSRHLLSVLDMNLSQRLEELVGAGVTSFKIEGRLKDEAYVKNTVAHYRMLLDRIIAGSDSLSRSSSGRHIFDFEPDPDRSFSRGSSVWMLDGQKAALASLDTPKATGPFIGNVTEVGRDHFTVSGGTKLSAGDGICFLCGGKLMGTNVNRAEGHTVFPNKMDGIAENTKIYRNSDIEFEKKLRTSRTKRVIDTKARVRLSGSEIVLSLTDCDGNTFEVRRDGGFAPAENSEKMLGTISTQVAKSGDTPFNIAEVVIDCQNPGDAIPFIPVSLLNSLRREALEGLLGKRSGRPMQKTIAAENKSFPYPFPTISGEGNVTNHLSEQFYREHGAGPIARGFDLRDDMKGVCVMQSAYCIRKETGECLKEGSMIAGDLYLRRGALSYRLEFDCAICRMRVIME